MKQFLFAAAVILCISGVSLADTLPNNDMSGQVGKESRFRPGTETVIESDSRNGRFGVVFEDDGETGYFYALDNKNGTSERIEEALHIYNVKSLKDSSQESHYRISWSKDGKKALLQINEYPHAIVDFEAKRGYCRTNFPAPQKWKAHDFGWSDKALELFR